MITSIKEWKRLNENILIPRNIEGRKEKLRQDIIKLLSQEIIENDIDINSSFEGIPLELIKVKEINGDVSLDLSINNIPEWLKDVKIYGDFYCSYEKLSSLKNCPQYIESIFNCAFNDLKTLEHGPKYVGRTYNCSHNQLNSIKGCPENINVLFDCSFNNLLNLEGGLKNVNGNLSCYNNIEILELPNSIKVTGKFENKDIDDIDDIEINENINTTKQFYHGSTDMNLDGKKGIHIGTKLAATQALQARIGVPAEGEWDGTREYGKTSLAGKKRLQEWDKNKTKGYYVSTGFNSGSNIPDNDYYPTERNDIAKYSDGTSISFDSKPIVFAVDIIGKMTNTQYDPRTDIMANSMMIRNLKKGNAKSGYYYINDGEDYGSISAVVPDKSFLRIKLNESILVPRNLEGRKEKLLQMNIKSLGQEIIEGDLEINETFAEIMLALIKVKEIKGNVTIEGLNYIPLWLKDVRIGGSFHCSYNKLKTLENCPQNIGGSFFCAANELTTLEGLPKEINGDLDISNNKLTSLEGCPEHIRGDFNCSANELVDFKYCPKIIDGELDISFNKLRNLEGISKNIMSNINVRGNYLSSLKGSPDIVYGHFNCANNSLSSLHEGPTEINGDFNCSGNILSSFAFGPYYIGGSIDCSYNNLYDLRYVQDEINGDFDCSHNNIENLKECPKIIKGEFNCSDNDLISLEGNLEKVGSIVYDNNNKELNIPNNLIITNNKIYRNFNENILVPRNLEGRKNKLYQHNIKLLSQEFIEGDLNIDDTFLDIPKDLIKVKEIKGNVDLNLFEGYIPSWLKYVKIYGHFDIRYNKLESLENCPQWIGKNFLANRNYLLTMKGGPIYVGGDYYCDNHVITLEHIAKYIGGSLIIYDDIKDTIPKDVEIKGSIVL